MANHVSASFLTRANSLFRKNLTYQKSNIWSNVRLIVIPFYLCVLLVGIQVLFDTQVNNSPDNRCGCRCIEKNGDGKCERKSCGLQYSNQTQASFCALPNPPPLLSLLQIPSPENRSVDRAHGSCRRTGSCPVTILVTGNNHSLGATLSQNLLDTSFTVNSSDNFFRNLAYNVLGTTSEADYTNYYDPGIHSDLPIFQIRPRCLPATNLSFSFRQSPVTFHKEVRCVQGLVIWRNNSVEVNDEIFKGYRQGNPEEIINEVVAAYDLLDTGKNNFNVTIWYNSTYKGDFKLRDRRVKYVRVPRSVNLVSNAYLQFLRGPGTKMLLDFVKEMPKQESMLRVDIASVIGPVFLTWVIVLLFPVILNSLVYEKQQRLRIIMKMHGLGDGPYWMITYAYFLVISTLYIICLMVFGSAIGLKIFRFNDYSIQFVFYFLCINLQISLAFLVSSVFSKVKTASVVAYLYVFGSGLLGGSLFQFLLEGLSFPRRWILVMELYPGFSLYRGLYEFSVYAIKRNLNGSDGMKWKHFSYSAMDEVFYIIIVEWFLTLIAAYYIDQVSSSGKDPFLFLKKVFKKPPSPQRQRHGSTVTIDMEKLDVAQESEKVKQLMLEPSSTSHAIVCNNLKKVYPGRDGNPPKMAVRGLSLAVPSGECFGMLGPNGAGKTSFINMMTGLVKPTSGTALVQSLDICQDMDRVYNSMGVCPQHDLLWETLTGREHLLFYGRLKNLKGSNLHQAVEESLKSVNLFRGGFADKPAERYSGGMKRRLSVAISLIGSPKVVYMDEPSTGLDPASRRSLWAAIKSAKKATAIILTTHSMEEAEFLCDRLGIFVDGRLQCIGNPKELKGRYGGSYVFTMTTSSEHEKDVEMLVQDVSTNAKKIYHIAGTQKFEIPKEEVRISEVFQAVEKAKGNFKVFAWGLADTTLEDVFIKVARTSQGVNVFS
ncbi:PREDICTED: ABC transporter A family member 4-like isoform X2 [Camelina sativa]|uniref:ABC transporter A family member 4-like isoform X1 n=1 Tax=Camelina sativa TaxID=90675 RepID=A0ABM1RMG5_CAMSA|nr:PREDICTED: ABC transporter A family member 4-like isoform X1 [Camelina sativa]XP_019100204.1 PREDICTED: ABC transporter A family member 4-like isoform X2 [Camelina sativa]